MKINRSKKKLRIRKTLEILGENLPETDLTKLINWLQGRKEYYESQGFSNIELCFNSNGWDNPYEISIEGIGEESDADYKHRMDIVQKEKLKESLKKQEHFKFIQTEARKLGILK